eukprot:gene38296-47283_t
MVTVRKLGDGRTASSTVVDSTLEQGSDKVHFTGSFRDDKRHACGEMTSVGPIIRGTSSNNVLDRGTIQYPGGIRYESEFVHEKRHGQGVQSSECSVYCGEWASDFKHGTGTGSLHYSVGGQYVGSETYGGMWAHDEIRGEGSLLNESGSAGPSCTQDGVWSRDDTDYIRSPT